MKPMIIIPPGQMSQADIKKLEGNQICVVVAKDPARVKFVGPIPCQSSRTEMENAAIKLSRTLLNNRQWNRPDGTWDAGSITKLFVEILVSGTSLDVRGTKEEQESKLRESARRDEIDKMAREDARAEREAKKKATPEKTSA